MNVDELMELDELTEEQIDVVEAELTRRLDELEPPSCMAGADPAAVDVYTMWCDDNVMRMWKLVHPDRLVHVRFEDIAHMDGTVTAGDGLVDFDDATPNEAMTPDEAVQVAEALLWARRVAASTDERRRRA